MSGRRSKYLRKILGIDIKDCNPISKRVYRRVKSKYTKLSNTEKSKFKIKDYV